MFGIWRTLLAIEVVAYHLLPLPLVGRYAVFSFFVLSGFLMTEIMHRTYGYGPGGSLRYLGNRALRLLPSYWFAALVTLILIAVFGAADTATFHASMAVPQSLRHWAQNASMIFVDFFPRQQQPRLVPPSWALTVEICYYVAIGLGASRTRLTTVIWLLLSFAYVIMIRRLHPEGGGYLYDAIPAGSLPFAVGALVWHYRDIVRATLARLRIDDPRLLILGRWLLFVAIFAIQQIVGWPWLTMVGSWLNIALSALIVCALFAIRPAGSLRRIDKAVGDWSYPIYLLHLQMGLVAAMIVTGQPIRTGIAVFAFGLLLTVLVGSICVRGIDPVVERWRSRIKQQ